MDIMYVYINCHHQKKKKDWQTSSYMFTMVATLYIFRICTRFKIYIVLRSNVGDADYGSYYCEVWTRDGEGGAVSMTAHIEPADSNLTSRLEKSMWRPEQQ